MRARRGSSFIEFTLVAIPIMFVFISIFEIGRGMWNYHTLAEAIREGARWAAVNGQTCTTSGNTCTCPIVGSTGPGNSIDCIARTIAAAAIGLPAGTFNANITTGAGIAVPCTPLSSCFGNNTALNNAIGTNILISASYQFHSALSMFWPGSKPVHFGTIWFPANTQQVVQY